MTDSFIKKRKSLSFLLAFLMIGSYLFFFYSKPIDSTDMTNVTPTLFIHGFKGGPGSFNPMIQRFERNQWGSKEMIYRVSTAGKLSANGGIDNGTNPFIQVIFKNNRATIADQTIWLQNIMAELHNKYGVQQVNLIGHSMGGLTTASFLVKNQEGPYPSVEKLVVMGSPFKGINNESYFLKNDGPATIDLKAGSQALSNLIKKKDNFDTHTGVLAIAGVINDSKTDGLVSLSSALGIKDIVNTNNYSEKVFYGPTATHSGLHEHPDIDQQIAAFLWNSQHN